MVPARTGSGHSLGARWPQPGTPSKTELRNVAVHGFADGNGDEVVFGTPDDEGGLSDGGEARVEEVVAGFHGVHGLLNDFGVAGDSAEGSADDEGWKLCRVRAEQGLKAGESGSVGGDEGGAREGGLEGDARGVVEDQAIDQVGVVEGDGGGDPSAHGPAVEIGVGEVDGVHEADGRRLLREEW